MVYSAKIYGCKVLYPVRIKKVKNMREARTALYNIAMQLDSLKFDYPMSVLVRSHALQNIIFKAKVYAGIEKM